MLERLAQEDTWQEFLSCKREKGLLTQREERELLALLNDGSLLSAAKGVYEGTYVFSPPVKQSLNKTGSAKKRVVYTFSPVENWILKLLAHLLYEYESLFEENLFSFRRALSPRSAFLRMANAPGIDEMWCFRADLSDYFNSIPVPRMTEILKSCITDDPALVAFLCGLLENELVQTENGLQREAKGVMAGTPTSSFLANLYLCETDRKFKNALYARYSDDVIIFADENGIQKMRELFLQSVRDAGLKVNEKKTALIPPHEAWSFLGFSYQMGVIDLSPVAVLKIMDKIRRAARAIRRWKIKNNADDRRALRAMIRKFNRKFYGIGGEDGLTWSKWYFSVINTDRSLHKIDLYFQQYLRYIVTGKHNQKSRGAVPYSLLRECGYRPLVHAYYKGVPEEEEL